MFEITINKEQIDKSYICYTLTGDDNELLYVGVSKLKYLFNFQQIKDNVVFNSLPSFTVKIILISNCKAECERKRSSLSNDQLLIKHKNTPHNTPIMNILTGEIFDSVKDAQNKYGGSTSSYYRHLSNTPGYATVKGQKYVKF